jgi:hypothetical protein
MGSRLRDRFPARWKSKFLCPSPTLPPLAGPIFLQRTASQYQEDIADDYRRRFDVEVGTCACCGRQAQGRHGLQTSDSLRVAEVQIGPEALSMAAVLNKEFAPNLRPANRRWLIDQPRGLDDQLFRVRSSVEVSSGPAPGEDCGNVSGSARGLPLLSKKFSRTCAAAEPVVHQVDAVRPRSF